MNEVRYSKGCAGAAAIIMMLIGGLLFCIGAGAQGFQHVHKGFHLIAEKVPSGGTVEMVVEKDLPQDLVFPLPSGKYNIYLTSVTDSMRATDYLRFNASLMGVNVTQGSAIELPSSTTNQALVLLDTAGYQDPVISLANQSTGQAWSMWQRDGYYYAYVDCGYEWAIGSYRFRPQPGETWKLNSVVVSFTGDPMDGGTVEPEPEPDPDPEPLQPVRIAGTSFAAQEGVIVQDTIVGYIEPGDWIRYLAEDFTGRTQLAFSFSFGSTLADRKMEVRLDSVTGPIIAEWTHEHTGSWNTFEERVLDIEPQAGPHEIFLTFTGDTTAQYHYVMNISWIELR